MSPRGLAAKPLGAGSWKMTLRELALRMRCSRCGKKAAEVGGGCQAEAGRCAEESALSGLLV